MPTGENEIDSAAAERLAAQLALIDDYPRNSEVREASAKQLQRICKGDRNYSALEQATLLVEEAIATIPTWCGWPGMRELFDAMFRRETPEKKQECPKCGGSGTCTENSTVVRCECERAKFISDDELAFWNAPPPERKPVVKETRPRNPMIVHPFKPITAEDIERVERELKANKNGDSE